MQGDFLAPADYAHTQVSGRYTLSLVFGGTVYAGNFQLERADGPSAHNLVENGSLSQTGSWTLGTGVSITGGAVQITGDPLSQATNAYQDIPLNLPGTETYVLSGWAKANAAPDTVNTATDTAQDLNKQFGLRAVLTYSDSTTEYHYIPFNADLADWQFTSMAIVPKEPAKTVASIRILCAYESNVNTACFDNISLVREAAQTMTYDGDGNLVSVTTTGTQADTSTYENGNLIQTVTAGSGSYSYTYDSTYAHRLTSATNGLITQSMGYDDLGNVTSTTLSGNGSGSKSMSTAAGYSSSGDRITSVTDATGAAVSYAYGTADAQMLGLPTAVTDPNGTVTATTYDTLGRISQTGIADWANLGYTYSNGNLTQVTRTAANGTAQTYSFAYDAFGKMTEARVGSRTIATYAYGENNGPLETLTYGNGDVVRYAYDDLGRITQTVSEDGKTATYVYTGDGQLYSITESKDGAETVTYLYTYDSLGRLISSSQRSGESLVLRTHQAYNDKNQLVAQDWQLGSSTYTSAYTYDDYGRLSTYNPGIGDAHTITYDGLSRLEAVTGTPTAHSYTYRDISDTQTTAQVSSLDYTSLNLSFGYTYDTLGNIATYSAPGEGTATYTYDALGQLLTATGDTTYTYTYDTVGNILTASDGTTTHSYTYGDSDWKDLLTAYDGVSLSYDASGNPTSYYNGTDWTFAWENGRNLSSATSTGNTLSFTYDLTGLRTSKTVNGTTHNYLYASGKLLRETYGNVTLDFFYDSNGNAYAFQYNGAIYYYVTNLQGDVLRIVDANGTTVATYSYDPYGRIISATGDLAEINPLRYRGYYYDSETGFYYLQSRYYDPNIGRFINADGLMSTGQGITGLDMFSYCGNNPISYCDPCGTCFHQWDFWNDCEKCEGKTAKEKWDDAKIWFIDNVAEPTVNWAQDTLSSFGPGTCNIGTVGSGGMGFAASAGGGIIFDTSGNIGIYRTVFAGGGFPTASFNVAIGTSNAPTIYEQRGHAYGAGGSIDVGAGAGFEYFFFRGDESGEIYHSGTFVTGIGWSLAAEVHGGVSYTWVEGFNIFDGLRNVLDEMRGA